MADRYPLIANAETKRIEELPTGDNLDLTDSGIVGATTITSDKFIGYLDGTAKFAENLNEAENILAGTISTERLSGYYNIDVNTSLRLERAENILAGTISTERLSGFYDIEVSRAEIVDFLQNAENIIEGIIDAERLSGVYDIDISGTSRFSEVSTQIEIIENNNSDIQYPVIVSGVGSQPIKIDTNALSYDPTSKSLGINTNSPNQNYNLYVNGGVGVSSSLLVSGPTNLDSTLDVVGGTNLQSTLGVVGNVNLDSTLDVVGGTNLQSTLGVVGDTNLGATLDVAGEANLQSTLGVAGPTNINSTLDVAGETNVQSTLVVAGGTNLQSTLDVAGETNIQSTLDVVGGTNLQSTLGVDGSTNLDSTLDVAGETNLQSTLGVVGGTNLQSTLGVDGSTNLGSTLDVVGDTNLQSSLDVSGGTNLQSTLGVVGEANLNSSLGVDGSTNLNSTLDVGGAANLSSTLGVGGATNLSSTLDVSGGTNLNSTLDVVGETNLNSNLGVGGETNLNSTLDVSGGTNLQSSLGVGGAANLNSTLDVVGETSLQSILGVDGAATLNSTLDVAGETNLDDNLNVALDITADRYFGNGETLVGIVTQIIPSIGINIRETQLPGKGVVTIDAYNPPGKTIYVNQNGNDNSTGLTENDAKRTIKSAASIALFGDTIKVSPGTYVEDNPIILNPTVSVEGVELRNCVITPRNPSKDLFHTNNGCHLTDMSFIGQPSSDGASIVSLQPLLGVEVDRFFDAARMIRVNLDFIANETVGFLTSGFSGFAGNHREQDASRLIDDNLDFIASEAVGFLTSPSGLNFNVPSPGTTEDCYDDIRDIFKSISNDLKSKSNKKAVGAALSYFGGNGELLHINQPNVPAATISTLQYAVGIAHSVINNLAPPISYQIEVEQTFNPSIILVGGGCTEVQAKISQLVGIITSSIGAGNTSTLPEIVYGVNVDSQDCAEDIKRVWKCVIHDITRGGNSRCVGAGKAYYDRDWNLIPQILKNPEEVSQTVSAIDYSFDIARAIINNSTWGGYPSSVKVDVENAVYDGAIGVATITALEHQLEKNTSVKIVGLGFTCSYDNGQIELTYPTGEYGYIFNVNNVIDDDTFEVVVGQSTIPHTYTSGGTIQKYEPYQHNTYQVKDLSIQPDPETGYNNAINGCVNVVSALKSCVGVVTSIVGLGSEAFSNTGIRTTFPGNSGIGFTSLLPIETASYNESSGKVTLTISDYPAEVGDIIEIRDLEFECESNGTPLIQKFPSGKFGYEFYIERINNNGSFDVYVGLSTIPHTYVEGTGFAVNRSISISDALYDNTTGITTITAPGAYVRVGDFVTVRNLEFSCEDSPPNLIFPSGKAGYSFKVQEVSEFGNTFSIIVGVSTLVHTYVGGGIVFPAYSRGVGPITQGPYVRNCTNFVSNSIGMKVDGFAAEPGDKDDIGVTGTMSVDSYTQFNQAGVGVSITNGAYAQLVSIFTICTDTAIYTASGGQCDITNSNCSFGNLGMVSDGVGDANTGSIYRMTGEVVSEAAQEQSVISVGGLGTYRPYDGQAIYFGELYYTVQSFEVISGGSGYTRPPNVIIDAPTGPNGIRAEALATVENGSIVSVDIISTGNQYRSPPNVSFVGVGTGAQVVAKLKPIYYTIEKSTIPSSGISTITLNTNLNNTVSVGTTVYLSRLSLQISSSHSFQWVGSGNNIFEAKPSLGGAVKTENEVVKLNGGEIIYTSTDQAGNFRIGDGIVINQLTGTISGRAFSQSILATVTPLIVAIG